MSRLMYEQESFIFHNRDHVATSESKGQEKIMFYLERHPDWSDSRIASELFNGNPKVLDNTNYKAPTLIKNPRLTSLELRVSAARAKITRTKPKAKPIRSRPIKKATNGTR